MCRPVLGMHSALNRFSTENIAIPLRSYQLRAYLTLLYIPGIEPFNSLPHRHAFVGAMSQMLLKPTKRASNG